MSMVYPFSTGFLSQWHKCAFTIDGVKYNCAEQYMMASKARLFGDEHTAELIMKAKTPKVQKELGRRVQGFDEKIWSEHDQEIVYQGNLAKFKQNPDLAFKLLATGNMILAEASKTDRKWGIGVSDDRKYDISQWQGSNLLGIALMRVRNDLR